jgi:hypothetical protein
MGVAGPQGPAGATGAAGTVAPGHVAQVFMASTSTDVNGFSLLDLNGSATIPFDGLATTYTAFESTMPAACTFDRLDVKMATTTGLTADLGTVVFLVKNGSQTSLETITSLIPLNHTSYVEASSFDNVDTVTVAAGDLVCYLVYNTSAQADVFVKISAHCQ